MGYYLQVDTQDAVPIASLKGWGDVIRWSEQLPPADYNTIHHLAMYGWEQRTEVLAEQFSKAVTEFPATDKDTAASLKNLASLLETAKLAVVVTVTDGLGPDDGEEDGTKSLPLTGDEDMPDTLVTFGGAVKAIGNGKVGGYLVKFSTESDPDLDNDFFQGDTDYDLDRSLKTSIYYNHGIDSTVGTKRFGMGEMKTDEVGVWVEAQLDMADQYQAAVYALAEQGKLGWSSGTAAHLVERKKVGTANKITKWPLGLDASLTPTPAEPRNAAISLKSWSMSTPRLAFPGLKAKYLGAYAEGDATMGAICSLTDDLYWGPLWDALYDEDGDIDERIETVRAALAEYGAIVTAIFTAIMKGVAGAEPVGSAMKSIRSHFKKLNGISPAGVSFEQELVSALAAVKGCITRAQAVAVKRKQDGRNLSPARRVEMKAIYDELATLLAETEPPVSQEDARKAVASFEAISARIAAAK